MLVFRPSRLAARFLLFSCIFVAISALAEDWPQFLGPRRNGTTEDKAFSATWPAEGPRTVWKKKVGAGWSAPVVSTGKLVIFHRVDDKEVLQCLDAKTGKELWSSSHPTKYSDDFGFDEGPRATPAASDESIYTFGAEGMLTCWRLSDGKKQWAIDGRKQFGAEKGFFGIACSPLIERDLVLMNIGGSRGAVSR